ncbi:MAG TPA: hypothetical protein DCW86_01845 [Actinobacteria bacterium]|nr:hypothetical protein [Actinomycetota bacterium]
MRNKRVLTNIIIVLVIIGGLLVLSAEARSRQASAGLSNAICLKCHPKIKTLGDREGGVVFSHRSHLPRVQRCVGCHREVGHKGEEILAEMSGCMKCHDGKKASDACDLCHEKREPKVYPKIHIGLDLTNKRNCFSCHSGAFCMDCHGVEMPHPASFMALHGVLASEKRSTCDKCHPASECANCHGLEMPHSADFAGKHYNEVKTRGAVVCNKCHGNDPGSPQGCFGGECHRYQ